MKFSSEQIGQLAAALSKAQGSMTSAAKDRENPFFKSTYATLSSVINAIRGPFSANGLCFSQLISVSPETSMVTVSTLLMHASGEWLSSELTAKPVKADPQGMGSLISYLKRYGLQAMAGVAAAEDDDDGNHASRPGPPPKEDLERKGAWELVIQSATNVKKRGGDPVKILGKSSDDIRSGSLAELYAAAEKLDKWIPPK